MRKRLITISIVLMALVLTMGAYYETRQLIWSPLHTAVTADDTVLTADTTGRTFAFSDKPSTAKRLNNDNVAADILFYGTDANDETVNYKVYVYKDNGPALLWCYGAATLGAAVTGATDTFYADTISVTTKHGSNATVTDSAANRVAVLHLGDLRGACWVYVEFDIPGSSQVASISAEITGY